MGISEKERRRFETFGSNCLGGEKLKRANGEN